MRFQKLIGNERVKEQIGALLDAGRLPHAVVLEGEAGLGKRTLAGEIAAALLCTGEKKPCYACAGCKKAQGHMHPDLFLYSADGGARSFHIDVVRRVISDVYMQPNEAPYKVYILGNAHLMSEAAQNAILKVLEEPPAYVRFILTVQAKSALLPTVLSRSVVFTLEGVPPADGVPRMQQLCPDAAYETALQALIAWNGNIGRAVQGLGDGRAEELRTVSCQICKALTADGEYALLRACAPLQKDRQAVVTVCLFLKHIFRDALLANEPGGSVFGDTELAENLAQKLTRARLLRLAAAVDAVSREADRNANTALIITKLCYKLREAVDR